LVDTSRNGWGGTNRPIARSTSSVLDTFVDQSRIDRRAHRGNWCNQPGGVGERPQVAPLAGIDAYVWVKPPGESDGAASLALSYDPQDPAKGFDHQCCRYHYRRTGQRTRCWPLVQRRISGALEKRLSTLVAPRSFLRWHFARA
jgi:cellulose 1,4-beta-cellobiosidase